MNIHVQFGFNHICSFWEEGIWIFWMFIGWSSTILRFFVPIWNSKWRLRQDLVYHRVQC
jgi:hypothetical protein